LALLALSPGQYRSREEVIDLIWPEVDFDEARNRFRQTIFVLRKQLEPEGVTPGSVLFTDRTQIGLTAGQTSDVAQFQQSLRQAALTTEPQERAQHLRVALALYKGEFAPGFYLDVLLTERERLKALAQSARERLAALEPTLIPVPPSVMVREGGERVRTENRFFGRIHEREHLLLLLQDFRLVTLLGPGGTGKTRLVQELSTERQDASFIGLSSLRNGADIPDAIVSALALPDSTETALQRLQAAFADKPALLILDNVEQLVSSGGAEAIARVLEAVPTVRLLVTSRLRLDLPQETVCQLAPLPEGDAVALFVDRARLATSHFALTEENEATVSELCRRLDGLPLAIELAAARATVLTPQQILERLSRRFDLLADKRRDREERHTSLRAALDWGWSLLTPDVQRFFTQLCVFRGSFSLDAAETVTGEPLAIDYLQSLADGSFLIREGERFRLLETLREYGAEKLSQEDKKAGIHIHTDFFLKCAKEWHRQFEGEHFASIMMRFKQDQANFLVAIDHALEFDPIIALDLCRFLGDFWIYTYWWNGALAYFKKVLDASNKLNLAHNQWASLYGNIGGLYQSTEKYESASFYHGESIRHLKEWIYLVDGEDKVIAKRSLAGMIHNQANNFTYMKRFDEAELLYREASVLNREAGNNAWLARNIQGLCFVYTQREDHENALVNLQQALIYARDAIALCRSVKQDYFLSSMLGFETDILLGLNCLEEALKPIKEGFELACDLENWDVVVCFCLNYYYIALCRENWEDSAQFLGGAMGISKRWGIPYEPDVYYYYRSSWALRESLPERLGKERYDLLFEAGTQASLDSLRLLAARMHAPSEPQRQAN